MYSSYLDKLFIGKSTIEIFISLSNGTINKLLQLDVVEVVADHDLQHIEQITIRDVSVVVDVVDLEHNCKTKKKREHDVVLVISLMSITP